MNTYSRLGLLLVGLLCLGVHVGDVLAGEVKITSVNSPFPSTVVEDQWNVRNICVSNTSDAPASVRAIYDTNSPPNMTAGQDQGQTLSKTRFFEDVTVAPHSARRFTMAIKPHGLQSAGTQMGQKKVDQLYTLEDLNGRPLGQQFNPTGELSRQQDIYIQSSMFDEGTELSYLAWWNPETPDTLPAFLERESKERVNAVVNVQAPQLPDRWYAYDLAHAVVLSNLDMTHVRPAQVDALLNWVRKGGVLVIAAGTHLPDMLQGELGQAAGVSAVSVHSVTSVRDVTDLRRGEMLLNVNTAKAADPRTPLAEATTQPADRRTVTFAKPLPMAQLLPGDATVLLTANGLPLVTDHPMGNGHVLVLALPTGALQHLPLTRLWRLPSELRVRTSPIRNDASFLVKPSPSVGESGHKSQVVARELQFTQGTQPEGARTAVQVLNEIAGRPGPVRAVPVGIMLAFAAGTIIVGGVLRLRRRGELIWVLLVPVAIAAGVAFFLMGATRTDQPHSSFVGLMTGVDDRHAVVQEVVSFYSGPGQLDKQFVSTDPQAVIEPMRLPGSGSLDLTRIRVNAPMALADVDCRPDMTFGYMMQSVVATGGIDGSLTFGPQGLTGRVTNRLGQELKDPVLYVNLSDARPKDTAAFAGTRGMMFYQNRQSYPLADLGEAQGMDIRPDEGTRLAPDAFTSRKMLSPTDHNRVSLIRQVVGLGDSVQGTDPMLVGYVEGSLLAPSDQKANGWRIVAWPVKLQAPAAGTKVLIPSPFVRLAFLGATGYDKGHFVSQASGGPVTIMVRLPRVIKTLDNPVVHLKLDMQASAFDVNVSGIKGFSPDGKNKALVPLKSFPNAAGMCQVDVPSAQDYYDPDFGFCFRMMVTPSANSDREQGPQWQIVSIDVSIEGTTRD